MFLKTVKVTNPKNVLVQIPGYVIAQWQAQHGDNLEVYYDEKLNALGVRKEVRTRG